MWQVLYLRKRAIIFFITTSVSIPMSTPRKNTANTPHRDIPHIPSTPQTGHSRKRSIFDKDLIAPLDNVEESAKRLRLAVKEYEGVPEVEPHLQTALSETEQGQKAIDVAKTKVSPSIYLEKDLNFCALANYFLCS